MNVCLRVFALCSPSSSNQSKIRIERFNYESFQVLIYYYATNIAILDNNITFPSPFIIAGLSYVEFEAEIFFIDQKNRSESFFVRIVAIQSQSFMNLFGIGIGIKCEVKMVFNGTKSNAFSSDFDFFSIANICEIIFIFASACNFFCGHVDVCA